MRRVLYLSSPEFDEQRSRLKDLVFCLFVPVKPFNLFGEKKYCRRVFYERMCNMSSHKGSIQEKENCMSRKPPLYERTNESLWSWSPFLPATRVERRERTLNSVCKLGRERTQKSYFVAKLYMYGVPSRDEEMRQNRHDIAGHIIEVRENAVFYRYSTYCIVYSYSSFLQKLDHRFQPGKYFFIIFILFAALYLCR